MKEALGTLSLDPKQWETAKNEKRDFTAKRRCHHDGDVCCGRGQRIFPARAFSSVWRAYEKILAEHGGMDFDDLLGKTVLLFRTIRMCSRVTSERCAFSAHRRIPGHKHGAVPPLHSSLAGERKNICVVGDMDQCLPQYANRSARLHSNSAAEEGAIWCTARRDTAPCACVPCRKCINGHIAAHLVAIKTKNGARLSFTPGHMSLRRSRSETGMYYTYLMYRRDRGFRVGVVQSIRSFTKDIFENGLCTRSNQEHADRIWILKISPSRAE